MPVMFSSSLCRILDVQQHVIRLKKMLLQEDDFETVSTLSRSGSFSRVDLVQSDPALSSSYRKQLFISKTVEKSWGYRMRYQNSLRNEVDILILSRTQPNAAIPRLIGTIMTDTHFQIIMSYALGGDLAGVLSSQGNDRLDEGLVKRWMAETMEAIDWLHRQGWCHRDVKPNNVLINERGKILLTDFGSAAPLRQLAPLSSRNRTYHVLRKDARTLIGTPDYIAPEILKFAESWAMEDSAVMDDMDEESRGDERAYGAEVDIWSFGVVVYEVRIRHRQARNP